jgi:hypothetical protein
VYFRRSMTSRVHNQEEHIQQLLADMALFPEMNPGPVCRLTRDGFVILANTKAKRVFGNRELTLSRHVDSHLGIDCRP